MDDGRYVSRYDEWDIDALYEHYFDLVLRAAESGHFDTMKKFGHRARKELSDLYGRVARRLAAAGVAIEVNTAGLRKPVAELYPHLDLLTACRKAGVPSTLGSDAHAPEEVARDLPQAIEHLRAAGYERILTFQGRRRAWKSL
jgi:histidinol-phosphatase (PHP family)